MLAPRIPRSEWPRHPHFPTQALLLDSHDAFRGHSRWIMERLRDLAPRGAPDARRRRRWLARMRDEFRWWIRGMHGHERYEENKLYPYLARRYDVSFDDLAADHAALRACEARVKRGFVDALADDGQARSLLSMLPLAQLIQELEHHGSLLVAHLAREEDRVIPMLLELPTHEFRRFDDTPIAELLQRLS